MNQLYCKVDGYNPDVITNCIYHITNSSLKNISKPVSIQGDQKWEHIEEKYKKIGKFKYVIKYISIGNQLQQQLDAYNKHLDKLYIYKTLNKISPDIEFILILDKISKKIGDYIENNYESINMFYNYIDKIYGESKYVDPKFIGYKNDYKIQIYFTYKDKFLSSNLKDAESFKKIINNIIYCKANIPNKVVCIHIDDYEYYDMYTLDTFAGEIHYHVIIKKKTCYKEPSIPLSIKIYDITYYYGTNRKMYAYIDGKLIFNYSENSPLYWLTKNEICASEYKKYDITLTSMIHNEYNISYQQFIGKDDCVTEKGQVKILKSYDIYGKHISSYTWHKDNIMRLHKYNDKLEQKFVQCTLNSKLWVPQSIHEELQSKQQIMREAEERLAILSNEKTARDKKITPFKKTHIIDTTDMIIDSLCNQSHIEIRNIDEFEYIKFMFKRSRDELFSIEIYGITCYIALDFKLYHFNGNILKHACYKAHMQYWTQ